MAEPLAPRDTTKEAQDVPWRTWLVLGDKRGDNGQVEEIAQALGWPCERKLLQMRERYILGKPKVAALEPVGELKMVEAQQMQNRRL